MHTQLRARAFYGSFEAFVGATRTELDAFADCAANQEAVDLHVQMRRMTLNVVLDVTFGLGSATRECCHLQPR
jgi:hypothetical protein